jgi:hypothetical protein
LLLLKPKVRIEMIRLSKRPALDTIITQTVDRYQDRTG